MHARFFTLPAELAVTTGEGGEGATRKSSQNTFLRQMLIETPDPSAPRLKRGIRDSGKKEARRIRVMCDQ